MKNIKHMFPKVLVAFIIVFASFVRVSYAEDLTIALTVRSGDTVIYSGTLPIHGTGMVDLNDSNGSPHSTNADSVLSMIHDADLADTSWEISNLQYFDSFGAFYLKCLTSIAGENCDNWQYVVDGASSFASMDQNVLSGGENVYVYFGPQNKVTLSSNAIDTNDTLTVTTEDYDYENNGWVTRTGVTVGLTQPNPSDPFNPTEITTSAVDGDGHAVFSNIAAGSYNVGVREDYYFPTEALTVTAAPTLHHSGGGGSGSTETTVTQTTPTNQSNAQFNLKKAFDFLISKQKDDGSFGEDIYTDWVAIALASGNYQPQTIQLIKYFTQNTPAGTNLTDYERHAMALLSVGLNPYNTNGINYIKKITDAFDGKQFGSPTEDNDDIFALIVLRNAGFKSDEKMLTDSANFILGRQKDNGSWDNSVDMTGAALVALTSAAEKNSLFLGVSQADEPRGSAESADSDSDPKIKQFVSAIAKAKDFLKDNQKADGGFGNVSATTWAIEGILALNEKPDDWKEGLDNTQTPFTYLATQQDTDGGMINEDEKNKIWETAYAVKAYAGKGWNEVMQSFEKPNDAGTVLGESTEKKAPIKKLIKIKKENPVSAAITLPSVEEQNTLIEPKIQPQGWFTKFLNFIF